MVLYRALPFLQAHSNLLKYNGITRGTTDNFSEPRQGSIRRDESGPAKAQFFCPYDVLLATATIILILSCVQYYSSVGLLFLVSCFCNNFAKQREAPTLLTAVSGLHRGIEALNATPLPFPHPSSIKHRTSNITIIFISLYAV